MEINKIAEKYGAVNEDDNLTEEEIEEIIRKSELITE